MNAIEMLIQQLDTVNIRLNHTARDLTAGELVAQPLPVVNPIGFIIWHMVRSQDWAANTAIRDVPEVITREPWRDSALAVPGMGTGFDGDAAAGVAHLVHLETLLGYADAVHSDLVAWLATQDDSMFDTIPDAAAHYTRFPEYQTAGFLAEMDSGPEHDDAVGRKGGLPAWVYLTSVAVTHLHRHLGEVDLVKDVLRRG
jgi:hypothetical protein